MSISQPDEPFRALPLASGPQVLDENATESPVWKLTLAYDGTDYHGWQIQPDPSVGPTIQGALADAIATVTGRQILPQGSGRTDAGVHAAAQVVSFRLAIPIPPQNFRHALNRTLPGAIRVTAAEIASPDFHARRSAIGKIYRYRIFQGDACSPFLTRYIARSRWPLNLTAMQQAAHAIFGEQDFTSFAACDPDRTTRLHQAAMHASPNETCAAAERGSAARDNIRRIDQSEWSCEPFPSLLDQHPFAGATLPAGSAPGIDPESPVFTYTVRGNGFLHHMVRNLVGTFLEVGRGAIAPTAIEEILHARNRSMAGPTAPAQGLCLVQVLY